MAFDYFRNFLELLNGLFVHMGLVEVNAYESTNVITYPFGFDFKFGTLYHSIVFEFPDALVDGCSGYAAFTGDLKVRFPGVMDQVGENFPVGLIHFNGLVHIAYRLKVGWATKVTKIRFIFIGGYGECWKV